MADRASSDRSGPPITLRQAGIALAVAWFVVVVAIGDAGDLTGESSRMLAVFGAAVILWITEAIPLAATSIGVILAEILLISDEAVVGLSDGYDAPAYQSFFATLAHPVLMLFLGGFVLADAAAKYRLDRNLAGVLLRPFGRSPRALVGGLMAITATLSMFMSNTATTAAMMAVVLPVAAGLDAADPLRVSLVLSVPVAANVGGLGTPVGSPPNAIALGRLSDEGIDVNFLEWMLLGVPVAIVALASAWAILVRRYPAGIDQVELSIGGAFDRSRDAMLLYVVFGATVLGWITEPFHGIPSSIVGFTPVVLLLATKVVGVDDLRHISWHVLWLVGGGIALGNGVTATGLDDWLVGLFDWSSLSTLLLLAALAALSIVMSTLISNSATANLVVPIGVGLATSAAIDLDPLLAGVVIAMSCSLAMALPVSTPPNAVAYATGNVATRDLAIVGLLVGAIGLVLVVLVAPPIWEAVGLL
ncbi:MAG: DASS family sodium-coupled anion symporter [Ilumatobacter sp.]|uniref:SLC13 family permease n=1 Tax=Ilumatobacter sp. TaxID=1967498 RepID=UPI002603E12E|nr:DASS family sodium-coupled anion symporter [Ilumatobacter sp.]MDJ0767370.1 DASS family sodium-coupled anion symporter [Ilumatobacter sp.]